MQDPYPPKDCAISLLLEATEYLENFQWKNEEETSEMLKNKKGPVEDELVDVLYWVLLIARDLDIDLEKTMHDKFKRAAEKYPIEKCKGKHTKWTEL